MNGIMLLFHNLMTPVRRSTAASNNNQINQRHLLSFKLMKTQCRNSKIVDEFVPGPQLKSCETGNLLKK